MECGARYVGGPVVVLRVALELVSCTSTFAWRRYSTMLMGRELEVWCDDVAPALILPGKFLRSNSEESWMSGSTGP